MKYSIIITTYNKGKYIKKCLESIINQTVQNFKLIIIDDGSTDNTKEIIAPYLKAENVEYYYKKNTGVADSRNFGVSKVKTKYFLFVDSDDYIASTLIETIDKYNNYEILSFKSIKVAEDGSQIEKLEKGTFELIKGTDYLKDLMSNSYFFLVPWGYVYNTQFWKRNDFKYPEGYVMEDTGLTPIIILNASKIISIDYYGYYYVQSKESIMRTNDDEKIRLKIRSVLFQYDMFIEYINSKNYDNELKIIYNNYFAKLMLWFGSALKNKFLTEYAEELKNRDIANKLKIVAITTVVKVILCKINYILYFKVHRMLCKKENQ